MRERERERQRRERERASSGEEAGRRGKNGRAYLKEAVTLRQQSHGNGEGVATKRRRKSRDGHGGRWMVWVETTLTSLCGDQMESKLP